MIFNTPFTLIMCFLRIEELPVLILIVNYLVSILKSNWCILLAYINYFVFRPLQRGQYPATTSQSKFHIHNEFKQDWLKFDDKKPAMDTEAGKNRGSFRFFEQPIR